MGAIADAWYVHYMNQGRHSEDMAPDPNGPRLLPKRVPAKWAVLQVLTTNCWLSVKKIQELLGVMSYPRSKSTLNKALIRCHNFGLAVSLSYKRRSEWKLTERGKDVANTLPGKVMKEPACDKVHTQMVKADKWLSIDDLSVLIPTISKSTIRKVLKRDGVHADSRTMMVPGTRTLASYKGKKIPGDTYGRSQWALAVVDTTNWPDAAPKIRPKLNKPKKVKAASASFAALNPFYRGFKLMCLSATTGSKPSLIRAVGDLVTSEFVPANKKFSAHDVTKRLRELLESSNTTTINPAETGTVHVQGKPVPRVNHDEVREIVHELFNQGALQGYDRVHTGQYFEYDLVANIAAQVPASPTATSSPSTTPATTPAPAGTDGGSYDGSSTI